MTTYYKIIHYDSWNELKKDIAKDICGNDCFPHNRYAFRGQCNENWRLMATFDRQYGKLAFDERQKLEEKLLSDFRDLCITWDGKEKFKKYTQAQLITVAQHYGLPTRLLDWSYSLYIAAFFAFSDMYNKAENIAIWVLDRNHEIWNAGYGVTIETCKTEENDRQRYQYGIFTSNRSPAKTIEDYIEICAKEHPVDGALYKIILPISEQKIALNDLEMMGINPFILFRGMEGCAKTAVLRSFINFKGEIS